MANKKPAKKPSTKKAPKAAKSSKIPAKSAKSSAIAIKSKGSDAKRPFANSFKLTIQTIKVIKTFWKPLLGIIAVYAVINLVFASGIISDASSTVNGIKTNIQSSAGTGKLANAIDGFGVLLAGNSGSSQGSTALQSLLLVIGSLAIIWALRRLISGEPTGVKQAYYQSMTPLVPLLIVTFFTILQLMPAAFGAAAMDSVFATVQNVAAPIAVGLVVAFGLLTAWSLYMLSSTVIAVYIVTLPGMHPRRAMKAAKKLVVGRRFKVIRRMLFLPLIMLLATAALVVPVILIFSAAVPALFFAITMVSLLFAHTYLYNMYKSLIDG